MRILNTTFEGQPIEKNKTNNFKSLGATRVKQFLKPLFNTIKYRGLIWSKDMYHTSLYSTLRTHLKGGGGIPPLSILDINSPIRIGLIYS